MSKEYTINIPLGEKELQQILHEDKSFDWTFPAPPAIARSSKEDEYIEIKVILHKENYEEI